MERFQAVGRERGILVAMNEVLRAARINLSYPQELVNLAQAEKNSLLVFEHNNGISHYALMAALGDVQERISQNEENLSFQHLGKKRVLFPLWPFGSNDLPFSLNPQALNPQETVFLPLVPCELCLEDLQNHWEKAKASPRSPAFKALKDHLNCLLANPYNLGYLHFDGKMIPKTIEDCKKTNHETLQIVGANLALNEALALYFPDASAHSDGSWKQGIADVVWHCWRQNSGKKVLFVPGRLEFCKPGRFFKSLFAGGPEIESRVILGQPLDLAKALGPEQETLTLREEIEEAGETRLGEIALILGKKRKTNVLTLQEKRKFLRDLIRSRIARQLKSVYQRQLYQD